MIIIIIIIYIFQCRKRQVYVDKVSSLQKMVSALKSTYQKREQIEQKLRNKLEKEIEKLKGMQVMKIKLLSFANPPSKY